MNYDSILWKHFLLKGNWKKTNNFKVLVYIFTNVWRKASAVKAINVVQKGKRFFYCWHECFLGKCSLSCVSNCFESCVMTWRNDKGLCDQVDKTCLPDKKILQMVCRKIFLTINSVAQNTNIFLLFLRYFFSLMEWNEHNKKMKSRAVSKNAKH